LNYNGLFILRFGFSIMKNTYKRLLKAISNKDFQLIEKLLDEGADINVQNEYGESVLRECLFPPLQSDPKRYKVIKYLLDHGADPTLLDDERNGPLQIAMFGMDTEMLKLLLDYGADPNAESGFDEGDTLYNWAKEDYLYNVYDWRLPEEPTEADKIDEETWLAFLQRLAEKYDTHPPEHLFLLRSRGARCAHELKKTKQNRQNGTPHKETLN
jgi:hypothetical protein